MKRPTAAQATTEGDAVNEVPYIRSGVGARPADGGCVMQVADWIATNGWTDSSACVHPVIRSLAIELNDNLDDEDRQKLLDFIPRMLNTAGGDEALTRKLLGFLARQVYPIYAAWAEESGYDDEGAVLACVEAAEHGEATRANEAAEAARAARAAWAAMEAEAAFDPFALLTGLLDRYDELTGRCVLEEIDLAPVVRMLVAAKC